MTFRDTVSRWMTLAVAYDVGHVAGLKTIAEYTEDDAAIKSSLSGKFAMIRRACARQQNNPLVNNYEH